MIRLLPLVSVLFISTSYFILLYSKSQVFAIGLESKEFKIKATP